MRWVRMMLRPVGYLMFVIAVAALSASAKLLGEKHELGFFSGRVAEMVWRYPEVTRPGVQIAWITWVVLFVVAISPFDPIASSWDEVALAALALIVLWRRFFVGRQAGN
ncbi:MAG: hypothetical protein JOZ73_11700 [Solirubrobacterales bacterium]|nr:hypothetical protein [Solirubrobacterales bacterium]